MSIDIKTDHKNYRLVNINAESQSTAISAKMLAYIKSHCSGLSAVSVNKYLSMHQELIKHFQSNTQYSIPLNRRKDFFIALTWGLMANAIENDEGFTQGMFKFEDPNHQIVEFFRDIPDTYRRPSSHYKERVAIKGRFSWIFNAYAIDSDKFPAGHRTAIFAPVQTLCRRDFSFLKIENHSANPIKMFEFLQHSLGWITSRGRVYGLPFFRSPKEKDFREEDTPKEITKEFKQILEKAPKEHKQFVQKTLKQAHHYGIAGIWQASQDLQQMFKKLAETTTPEAKKVWEYIVDKTTDLRIKLETEYPADVHIRKGKEVVLTDLFKQEKQL